MDGQDDRGGLSEQDELLLEFWLRFAALAPDRQRIVAAELGLDPDAAL